MSLSDTTGKDASAAISLIERLADTNDLGADDVRDVVSAATRLYADACTRAGQELPPLTSAVSTTDLTPFDMAMWFSRGTRHP
jgi:hypothetical protein